VRIQFVVPTLILTGGIRVVFEHARGLRARGHDVWILAPVLRVPRLGGPLGAWKHYLYERWSGRAMDGLASYGLQQAVRWFDPVDPSKAPDADAVVATAFETAEWVARFPEQAGRRFYLVQGYEAWTRDLEPRVDATWRLPLRKIVIAGWLQRLATERFGEKVWARIPNGVDAGRFHPPAHRNGPPFTVGMIYDPSPHKGVEDGVAALWRIHESIPETKFLLFGRARVRHRLPPGTRHVRDPRQADLPGVYGSFHVFVSPSHSEGFSLVILEAMACGCATVATAVGETPEMGVPGREYEMVPPGQPEALADKVIALLRDPRQLHAVAAAGLERARAYDWGTATDRFESALTREA